MIVASLSPLPGSQATATATSAASTGRPVEAATALTGAKPLTNGPMAFFTTLMASAKVDRSGFAAAAETDSPDLVSLNSVVASFQSTAASYVAEPLEALVVDVWFVANGLVPSPTSAVNARVDAFAEDLTGFIAALADRISFPGDSVSDAAEQMAEAIGSVVADTYLVDFGLSESEYITLSPAAIGFGASAGVVTFDADVWQAAYETNPTVATVTFNVLAEAVLAAAQSY